MASKLQAVVLPSVKIFSADVNTNYSRRHTFIELPRENTSSVDIISQLLHRNAEATLSTEMTGEQIQNLLVESSKQKNALSTRYPFELVTVIIFLCLGLVLIGYQSFVLSKRLAAHEQHDSAPPGERGREVVEMQEV